MNVFGWVNVTNAAHVEKSNGLERHYMNTNPFSIVSYSLVQLNNKLCTGVISQKKTFC